MSARRRSGCNLHSPKQAEHHSGAVVPRCSNLVELRGREVPLSHDDLEDRFDLMQGAPGDIEVVAELPWPSPAGPFGDVQGDRVASTAPLIREHEALTGWQASDRRGGHEDEVKRRMPRAEISEVAHSRR